jgi:hypothetical protein
VPLSSSYSRGLNMKRSPWSTRVICPQQEKHRQGWLGRVGVGVYVSHVGTGEGGAGLTQLWL